jgi:hypothetical protein
MPPSDAVVTIGPVAAKERESVATASVTAPRIYSLDPTAVIVGCLTFALVLFLPAILNDGDTLWQIRTGEWILDHRAIPAIDPFSYTAGDRPWFAHEWFAETLLALAWRAAGLKGVMVLAAAAIGLTAAVIWRYLRQFLPTTYAAIALIFAFANAAPSMLARPHVLAWPCLTLWCVGLLAARGRRAAPAFALLPIMALWVNLHGSFMLGLLLPGVFMIEALFDPDADRGKIIFAWGKFIVAAWITALLNPDFISGVLFPIHLVGMSSLSWIGEWAPAEFGGLQPLEVTLLAGLALGLSGKVSLPPIRLLMLLGLVHGALSHGRNEQLLGLIGALILAEPLGRRFAREDVETPGAARAMAAGAALVSVLAVAARFALPLDPVHTGEAFAATLDHVPPSLRDRPVLNDYSLGGLLIFNRVRPFVDSRADLYGDAFLTQYQKTIASRAAFEKAVADYGIAWTIFQSNRSIVHILDEEPGWRRLVETDGVVIHVRDDQAAH